MAKRNPIIAFIRYLYAYFNMHIILFVTSVIVIVYYILSVNSRDFYINDSYIINILDSRLEYSHIESLDVDNYNANSVILIGAINRNINNKNYDKAIELIEQLKKSVNSRIIFYKYLTIRQALLYMFLINDEETYRKMIVSKYPYIEEHIIKSIMSVFRLRKV